MVSKTEKTELERIEALEKKVDLIVSYLFEKGNIKSSEDEEDQIFSVEEKLERIFNYLEIDMKRATPGVTIKRM